MTKITVRSQSISELFDNRCANPRCVDIDLTKDLKSAGKFLHIPVPDHIILTSEGYYSFADEGLLEPFTFMIFVIRSNERYHGIAGMVYLIFGSKSTTMSDKVSHQTSSPFSCKLFDRLPGVYYTLKFHNPGWEVLSVTEQANGLFGYSREEIFENAFGFLRTIIHAEDLQMVYDTKSAGFRDEEKLHVVEFRIRTKAGEIKYVRDQYISYQQDGFWLMEGYLSETFKTSMRDRLLQQLRSYREAVDVNMISSITDRKGKIVYANYNFCKVSKYAMWELIGQNHRIVNSGYHAKEFFENLWKTIAGGNVWQGEIQNKAKDGSLYWVDTVIIPIFDEERNIVNYLSLRTLINERKQAENDRQKYIHLLEQIAFIVAHNVRSPLCSILGLADILANYRNSTEEVAQAIGMLKDSAEKLNLITKKLSEFVYENEIEMKVKNYKE